jgi:hypothetical protein
MRTIEDLIDLSYNEVVYQKQLNNVTDKVYGHYMFLWLWSADRSDFRHERFYKKYGAERYWRRIDRVLAYATAIRKRKREQLFIGRSRIATV